MWFEKNFEEKVNDIGKAFTKAIDDYNKVIEEADVEVASLQAEIASLQKDVESATTAQAKAIKISSKLKEIFGE